MTSQQIFKDSLNDLFDITHRDALSLVIIEEDTLFLEAQRERGRRGTMGGIDGLLTLKEERVMKRKAAADKYALQNQSGASTSTSTVVIDVSDSELSSDLENELSTPKSQRLKPKLRGEGSNDTDSES